MGGPGVGACRKGSGVGAIRPSRPCAIQSQRRLSISSHAYAERQPPQSFESLVTNTVLTQSTGFISLEVGNASHLFGLFSDPYCNLASISSHGPFAAVAPPPHPSGLHPLRNIPPLPAFVAPLRLTVEGRSPSSSSSVRRLHFVVVNFEAAGQGIR